MSKPTPPQPDVRRLALAVRGVVQGVGFRPFVYNTARSEGLAGWVRNEADVVRIEVQGPSVRLDAFLDALRHRHPPQASIERLDIEPVVCVDDPPGVFEIVQSLGTAAPRPTIPADLTTCAECLAEIRNPAERRYGYPFTNCTACGPRWSIIEQLPYDRPRTSMRQFTMCDDCRREYEDPTDRRFHAQPIACPRCGPKLSLLRRDGSTRATEGDALAATAEALLAGQIVALKGLGGFQLLVDATNARAVAELRQRKQRPDRPFALMMNSLEEVRRHCCVSEEESQLMTSPQSPIVLVQWRRDGLRDSAVRPIVDAVAPGNPYLGVMLPYTPLHYLLMDRVQRPIVCTSGNLSEEPMVVTTEEALKRLGPIADVILTHDRPIVRPVDDSIARVGPSSVQVLRRARGYAPSPIALPIVSPTVVAVGGHLKNTVALALGNKTTDETPDSPTPVVVSQHLGNLESVLSLEVHRRAIDDLVGFFEAAPERVACDLHPDYASTQHAEALAARWNVPLVRVQHHHAHVAALMAEHGLTGPLLGFSWDGTGYGPDGTVWGGECLLCEGGSFRRVAHLRTFPLPGGDRAVREPRRSALGLLFELLGKEAVGQLFAQANSPVPGLGDWFRPAESKTLLAVLSQERHAPRTSSMGRLFDAVAALCGLPATISFEGQAAMALEFLADEDENEAYPLPLSDSTPAVIHWGPMIRGLLEDRAAGVPARRIAAKMHNALAEAAVAVARAVGCPQVGLTGGCFQNALLGRRVHARLSQAGFSVYTHSKVPPNDGGIALGQVFVAAMQNKG